MATGSRSGTAWRLTVLLATTFGCQVFAAPVVAQTAKPGTIVRVTAPEHMEQPCIGRVVAATDPLVVRDDGGTIHSIPTRQIELLEIQRTRSRRGREALLGGLVGAIVGGAVGYATYEDQCDGSGDMFCFDLGPAFPAAAFGSIGGLLGMIVGYHLAPQGWRTVWQREVETHVGLTPEGVRIRLELRTR
jgi:hypothetical protein